MLPVLPGPRERGIETEKNRFPPKSALKCRTTFHLPLKKKPASLKPPPTSPAYLLDRLRPVAMKTTPCLSVPVLAGSARAFCLAILGLSSALAAPPPEKPVFTCKVGEDLIEVFTSVQPFDASQHKFELVKKERGFETWQVDGVPVRGDGITLRGDGNVIRITGFLPSDFKTVLGPVEVRWNGKPGVITGPKSPCFNPSIDTDFTLDRHMRFFPDPSGRSIRVQFSIADNPGGQWVWFARRDAGVPGEPDLGDMQEIGTEDEPVLDCAVAGEQITVFLSTKDFEWDGHDIVFTKAWKKGEGVACHLTVDGDECAGTDSNADALQTEIARVSVLWNGKEVPIPAFLHKNRFNPNWVSCHPASDGQSVLVEMMGGDGGGSYGAAWILRKDGKHVETDGTSMVN